MEPLDPNTLCKGEWRCAKCGFRLSQRLLSARDGEVGEHDKPGERCPNDGSPLWRMRHGELCAEPDAIHAALAPPTAHSGDRT